MKKLKRDKLTYKTKFRTLLYNDVSTKQAIRKLAHYEDMERALEKIYVNSYGMIENIVSNLLKMGINKRIEGAVRIHLLVDNEIDEYEQLKKLKTHLINRLEPVYIIINNNNEYVIIKTGFKMDMINKLGHTIFFNKEEAYNKLEDIKSSKKE